MFIAVPACDLKDIHNILITVMSCLVATSKIVLTAADHGLAWSRTQATIGQGPCLAEKTGRSHFWIWRPAGGFPQSTASASCRRSEPSGHRAPCSGAPCNPACPACSPPPLLLSFKTTPWCAPFLHSRQYVVLLISQHIQV